MATNKRRINISTDKNTEAVLEKIAARDGVPLATKAGELLRLALEIEEDFAFAALAEERMGKKERLIPHHLAWK